MLNRIRSHIASRKAVLLGSAIASIVLVTVVVIPAIGQSIVAGFMYVPFLAILLSSSPLYLYILQGLVALMFGSVVAMIFYLLRIKSSVFVSGVGLSFGYVVFTLLDHTFETSTFLKSIGFLLVSLIIFYCLIQVGKHLKINTFMACAVFVASLGVCSYAAQVVVRPIEREKAKSSHQVYLDAQNQEFETVKKTLKFTVYYPTYSSSELSATQPKLNGYSQNQKRHTNPHVTYNIGKARVTQTALLKDQEKLVDFTRNCDITRLSNEMDSSSVVRQQNIEDSLENLSRCNVIHQTPAGNKVLFRGLGQWTTFYLQKDKTNIVIRFDDINAGKYSEAFLPEVIKIIDSLQPVSINRLQRGNEMLADRY